MYPWPGLMAWKSWGASCVTYMSTCNLSWRNNVTFSSVIDIYQKLHFSLDHKARWKPSHTNPCPTSNSHHHPPNKQTMLLSLVHRARAVGDWDSLHEMELLKITFRQNGWKWLALSVGYQSTLELFWPKRWLLQLPAWLVITLFSCWQGTTLSVLASLPSKIFSLLQHEDNSLWHITSGLHVSCKCGQSLHWGNWMLYWDQIQGTPPAYPLQTSSVAEHSINLKHCIKVQNTRILSTKSRNINHIIWEAVNCSIQQHDKGG